MAVIAGAAVSAIITTVGDRPEELARAVESVDLQGAVVSELVIVHDGTTESFAETAAQFPAHRVIHTGGKRGGNVARNLGVDSTTSDFVALLDDDDEWLPGKIVAQLERAREMGERGHLAIVGCRVHAILPEGTAIWPKYLIDDQTPAQYLLRQRGLRPSNTLLQTSMLLIARGVFDIGRFRDDLPRLQEWDFLIRVSADPRVVVEIVPEVLSVWHCESMGWRTSTNANWRSSLDWLDSLAEYIDPRTRASYIAGFLSLTAGRQQGLRGLLECWSLVDARWIRPGDVPRMARAFLATVVRPVLRRRR